VSDVDELMSLRKLHVEIEDKTKALIKSTVERFPIYNEFLKNILGLKAAGAGWIIAEFNIHEADTISKLWSYAGLNPSMTPGKKIIEPKKYKPSMGVKIKEMYSYTGDNGAVLKKPKLTHYMVLTNDMVRADKLTKGFVSPFNKRLRTALIGIVAPGLIKAGLRWEPCSDEEYNNLPEEYRDIRDKKIKKVMVKNVKCKLTIKNEYCQVYHDYKHRLAHSSHQVMHNDKPTPWKDVSKGHRESAAKRKMIKFLLQDIYKHWRAIEGLPVRAPYQEEYLGHTYSGEGDAKQRRYQEAA